ncbi:D-alanine--D-alanine ligase [Aliidiomarina shirensis]|uniref:D-alanine--D-alanine ligase n=1 Tax=Aliidiomarina shirensis TaxID=1048642 RepID=A0A432WUU2_9GAMM|nr:D-alanine--D-alanine ligase [Aliidiomarina shirensis]RUO37541.1 D-alanine--D-alanine ligase [Aliidiomarina shirensis]
MKAFGKVAVLAGGNSAEREVSLRSGAAILQALCDEGVDAFLFDPAEQPLFGLAELDVDRVFIALHGRGGEDGQVQAVLEVMDIPYTGSGILACALTMDKSKTKALWHGLGLPTAAASTVSANDLGSVDCAALLARLGGKVMVKPAHEGSSIGMGMARTADELAAALKEAARFDGDMLVETWLSGPEYTVAVLDGEALPAIKVQTPNAFYDYAAKYQDNSTQYICPAELPEEQEQKVRDLAVAAFNAVGCKSWGRVDMMMNSNGQLQLLELNTVPGMTTKSLVPMAAKQVGMSFSALVLKVLATTLDA